MFCWRLLIAYFSYLVFRIYSAFHVMLHNRQTFCEKLLVGGHTVNTVVVICIEVSNFSVMLGHSHRLLGISSVSGELLFLENRSS